MNQKSSKLVGFNNNLLTDSAKIKHLSKLLFLLIPSKTMDRDLECEDYKAYLTHMVCKLNESKRLVARMEYQENKFKEANLNKDYVTLNRLLSAHNFYFEMMDPESVNQEINNEFGDKYDKCKPWNISVSDPQVHQGFRLYYGKNLRVFRKAQYRNQQVDKVMKSEIDQDAINKMCVTENEMEERKRVAC